MSEVRADDDAAPKRVDELCFRIAADTEKAIPEIRATMTEAADRWGVGIRFDDSCDSLVRLGKLDRFAEVTHWEFDDGSELSAAYVGGASRITIDRDRLAPGLLVNVRRKPLVIQELTDALWFEDDADPSNPIKHSPPRQ